MHEEIIESIDLAITEAGIFDKWMNRNEPASLRAFKKGDYGNTSRNVAETIDINALANNKDFAKIAKLLGGNPQRLAEKLHKSTNGDKNAITKSLTNYLSRAVQSGKFGGIYKAYPINFSKLSGNTANTLFDSLPHKVKQRYITALVNRMIAVQQSAPKVESQPSEDDLIRAVAKHFKDNRLSDYNINMVHAISNKFGIDKYKAAKIAAKAKELALKESKSLNVEMLAESLDIVYDKPVWHF